MIHKAKDSHIVRYLFRHNWYEIYDAFETTQAAKSYADNIHGTHLIGSGRKTLAIVVDLGKEAGRLRYGVFVAKGAKI